MKRVLGNMSQARVFALGLSALGLSALALSAGCSRTEHEEPVRRSSQEIIYGQDDRTNIAQHIDARAALWSDSIAVLGARADICPNFATADSCKPFLQSAATFINGGDVDPLGGPLCSDQPFVNESRITAENPCTAFYVGNDRFMTAAHCIEAADCGPDSTGAEKGVLFNFTTDTVGNTPTSIPREGNFYRCESIVQRELQVFNPGRIDYAVFEVSPPVTNRRALRLRRSGAVSAGPPAEGTPATPLGIVGHGLTFPMKASLHGQVRNNTNGAFFYHTIDGFPGDSGAPIMNLEEGIVEGVHTAGPVPQSGVPPQKNLSVRNDGTPNRCLEFTSCAENACAANEVNRQWSQGTRITRAQILAAVPELPQVEVERPDEHVMIVLDRTGSMTLEGTSPGLTRWDDAINAAMGWVGVDSLSASFFRRAYSVWTFRRGLGQDGLEQVWPEPGGSDCENVDSQSGFCVFQPIPLLGTPSDYLALQAKLEEIRTEQAPEVGPTTPLAESLCEALEILRPLSSLRRVIFQADGGENSSLSAHPCAGIDSDPFENPFEDPTLLSQPDWGMTVDSWQANVMRRAARFDRPIADAVDGALGATDRLPVTLIWNVDVHFALQDAPPALSLLPSGISTLMASASTGSPSAGSTTFASGTEWLGTGSARVGAPTRALSPFTVATAQANAAMDIAAAELSLFKTLGASNALSSLKTYVRPVEPVVNGVDHALTGDVDDSGCVDQADVSIITQGDVWMRRAVEPLQIAIRADLSRDGWVNFADLQIALAHYGSGCINPVQPPNLGGIILPNQGSCDDGIVNGSETDIDCGGSCGGCADGAVCADADDCSSGSCVDNVCSAEPGVDICDCRPNKCNDCSNQIAACEATPGCTSIVACTLENPCSFPHESCSGGQSCHQLTGHPQSSAAGQAANNVISCFGGC